MRIHSLRLRDFRGVAESSIAFAERGVTIVEGPNEVGKSSLVEAIYLLFDELDSAKSRGVKEVKPVDRDVGPEVEAVVTSGPYRFTYRKRFLKRPETVLSVSAPSPQNLTGREAHERARAILEETMDFELWRALRLVQGDAISQAPLGEAPSLLRALDRVAGQETAGERETNLFERVEAEYRIYFTESGKPVKSHSEVLARAEAARAEVERLDGDLKALEALVDRSAEMERELATLRRDVAESAATHARRSAEAAELARREEAFKHIEFDVKSATMALKIATGEKKAREELIARFAAARDRRAALEADAARRSPDLKEAEERATAARATLAAAEERAREADDLAQLRTKDFEYRHAILELERLEERKRYVEEAQRRAEAAQLVLKESRITEEQLKAIRRSHLALVQATAQLDADSPQVQLRALREIDTEIDGKKRRLSASEQLDLPVPDRLQLLVPGHLGFEVRAGVGSEKLKSHRDEARAELAQLLHASGTRDLEHAEASLGSVREANASVAAAKEEMRKHLRDLTPGQIDEKIKSLHVWQRYPSERPPGPPLTSDHDSALEAKNTSRAAQTASKSALDAARERWRVADEDHQGKRERARETGVELRVGAEAERAGERELLAARAKKQDEAIDFALADATAKEVAAQAALAKERTVLQALNPENVHRLAENAARAAKSAEQALGEREMEAHGVRAQLELSGERGLFDAREEARATLARAELVRDGAVRRAAAAERLFLTMQRKREEARQAYRAPLRERIEQLGKLVFDDSFRVELDDSLSIVARTLGARTVPFASLSGGAREQLALIARLAAALIVDEKEGVPLLFDDTLGHTDPARLEGMGAMLALAGDRCQIVVLTCTPGRFRHVGGARVVRLDGVPPAGAR